MRLFLLALLLGAACNTPSIPLPPPQLGALAFKDSGTGAGMVVMQGQPEATHRDARFYVYNASRGDGVITTTRADGSFTTSPFPGVESDTVELYYERADLTRSDKVCVALRLTGALLSGPCR